MSDPNRSPSKTRRWTAIPAARSSAPVLRIRLWLVLGTLLAAAVLGAFGGIAWLTNQPEPPKEPPATPEATGFASEVAQAWLAGRPLAVPVAAGVDPSIVTGPRDGTPLAGVEGLAWDGFELLQPLPNRIIEVHRFVVGGNPPRQLLVTVELTDAGPVLSSAPSLEPMPLAGSTPNRIDYLDEDNTAELTEDVSTVATDWAAAYASDDRKRLSELTGDSESRVYAGLGGFSIDDVRAVSAYNTGVDGNWVVRVEGTLTSDTFKGHGEWDLLVSNPDTANPRVVAWGPPGTGLYLKPFQNGVRGGDGPTTTTTTAPTTTAPERDAVPDGGS